MTSCPTFAPSHNNSLIFQWVIGYWIKSALLVSLKEPLSISVEKITAKADSKLNNKTTSSESQPQVIALCILHLHLCLFLSQSPHNRRIMVHVLFLPIRVLSISLFLAILRAGPDPVVPSISRRLLSSERELISQFSADTEAESPGMLADRIEHHQSLNTGILVALIVCSAILGGIFIILLYVWIRRYKILKCSRSKNQDKAAKEKPLSPVDVKFSYSRMADKKSSVAIFDFQLLENATDNFSKSNILGESGSRIVYRACFDEHLQAAVKKGDCDADREFENEVNWLSKIRHQNIIKLLGYCIHGESRFLVYEMMNGSLDTELHGPSRGSSLNWHLRLRIAVDVARALEYLHEHCNPPLVHRDLKSSNILLDSNFNAKLSDFGLAISSEMQDNSMKMSGTLGYVAPEYISHGKLTDKGDVYAFGVVLLELLTGRKPMEMSSDQYESIVTWAMPQLTDRSKLPSILDPVIRDTMDLKHLYQVAAVAVLCVQAEPSYRPLITDVLHSLIPLVPADLGGSLRVI